LKPKKDDLVVVTPAVFETAGVNRHFPSVSESFPVLIMMPPYGLSPAEKWVGEGIQAACLDLIARIKSLGLGLSIHVLAAEEEDRVLTKQHGAIALESSQESFHFGKALENFIFEQDVERLAYFGAGSAPLISDDILRGAFEQILHADSPNAVVNNLHSTDWAIFSHAKSLNGIAERFPSDNPIGWVLSNEWGFHVDALPASAATRTDIDTPTDLMMMREHPAIGPHLHEFYMKHPIRGFDRIHTIKTILSTPANHLTIIGRASSSLWQELEKRTQIWTRIFAEERGMVASGRMGRGEVKSLIAAIVDEWGPGEFVRYLGLISDAVLWDTRVWMAHHGDWPSKADRFSADLGWVDDVNEPNLKELTLAISQSRIPILTGGHGIVAGGLLALLETISLD